MEPTPFTIKRNDTLPALVVNVKTKGDLGEKISFDLTTFSGETTTFSMKDSNGNIKIQGQTALITNAPGGSIQYNWQEGDTDTSGKYKGEFELNNGAGGILSVPIIGGISIDILDDINTY